MEKNSTEERIYLANKIVTSLVDVALKRNPMIKDVNHAEHNVIGEAGQDESTILVTMPSGRKFRVGIFWEENL